MKAERKTKLLLVSIFTAAAFLLTGAISLEALTPDLQPIKGSPQPDTYELRFLGAKVQPDPRSHTHVGLFLFIWKGDSPIKIYGNVSSDGKEIFPYPEFGLHHKAGWESVGPSCGTGVQWIEIHPGQVSTLRIGMGWIEGDVPGLTVKDADKACLAIACTGGSMISDVFPLPLFPIDKH